MTVFYDPASKGFYHSQDNNVPETAVEITDALYDELFAGQSNGKVIVHGENGIPSCQDPVVEPATYASHRAAEYPPITDYIDGVVKDDQSQIDAYIAACQAVKAKYPKPV